MATASLVREIARALDRPIVSLPLSGRVANRLARIAGRAALADRLLGSLELDCRRIQKELDWDAAAHESAGGGTNRGGGISLMVAESAGTFVAALVVTALLARWVRSYALARGMKDIPNERSSQRRPDAAWRWIGHRGGRGVNRPRSDGVGHHKNRRDRPLARRGLDCTARVDRRPPRTQRAGSIGRCSYSRRPPWHGHCSLKSTSARGCRCRSD